MWETVGMAKYSPKVNDTVFWKGHGKSRFVVLAVDSTKETADLQSAGKLGVVLHGHVPWAEFSYLDESQNAVRVVREATESE